ncbi:phosphate ABC transporter substrate-binding protein [Aureimonas sp. SA4125]|uniref:phosphate/phosphite/phosphonate ABC transporter substrate-binding protein n=1 Tax=Aureimonas sp. SA4125 TaxID=2826993 RepID=UPI001CC600A4|nr:PhnD/SsuA/transferrin family substrate-binding protein [Aureimonas sp. SA4125]BDA83481.1 phosphate ABC transporter substrate-binding protein [Aureimonas sp. SA4125]
MPKTLVSYPMYCAAPGAIDGFWRGLRRHLAAAGLTDVDADLTLPEDLPSHWTAPNLLLSQTCGYPLTHGLEGRVQIVGTPCYDAPGCEGPLYSSAFVVREGDPAETLADCRGRRVAFNSRDSQSGYNSLRRAVAPLAEGTPFFAAAIESGAHRRSMDLVRDDVADLAAIDCVSFALASDAGSTAGLRILGVSSSAPGLPLITAADAPPQTVARLRRAFSAACADPALSAHRAGMRLSGFEVLPLAAYRTILDMENDAIYAGYPDLA